MNVLAQPAESRVAVRLSNEADEASYVYDLVRSGRLQVEDAERLPLPFRGAFLFKLPDHPRPVDIQVGRFEATAEQLIKGEAAVTLLVAVPRNQVEVLPELEAALR